MDDWQDKFPQNLFVGRELELQSLIEWVMAPTVPRRLKPIVAPPGYGKSWTLHRLERDLAHQHGRELFLIRVPTLTLKSRTDIEAWLPSIVAEARRLRPNIRAHQPTHSPEKIIANFLEDLGQNSSPVLRPLLIVDAFDELLDNERRELETHLLEQFWANPAVRIIMAFRDVLSLLRPTLRRGEERFPLQIFSSEVGRAQLQKLTTDNPGLKAEDLLSLLPPYRWNHPKINSCLCALAHNKVQHHLPLLFTADEVRDCWVSLIEDKIDLHIINLKEIENDLKTIVTVEDTWTLETFATICKCDKREAHHRIQRLMAISVVVQAQSQRYQIIDGLRELLRAENHLREEGKE